MVTTVSIKTLSPSLQSTVSLLTFCFLASSNSTVSYRARARAFSMNTLRAHPSHIRQNERWLRC
jgi:hypothetical protein